MSEGSAAHSAPDATLSALIEAAYDAARDPGRWRDLLRLLSLALSEAPVCLIMRARAGDEPPSILHHGYPPGSVDTWSREFAESDPWPSELRGLGVDAPAAFEDLCPQWRLEATRTYREWCVRHGLGAGFAVKVSDDGDGFALLIVDCDPGRASRIRPAALRLMGLLSPHVRKSLELRSLMRDRRRRAMSDLLGTAAEPVLIVDAAGEILLANAAADEALKDGTLIARRPSGQLGLPGFSGPARIGEALALASSIEGDGKPRRALLPSKLRETDKLSVLEIVPLRIQSAPLADEIPFANRPSRACYRLSVRAPGPRTAPSPDELRAAFGLTEHEALAVHGIAAGQSLEDQADARGVSPEGIRWHLRNIYQKLNCRSKSELLLLVMGLLHP